MSDISSLNYLLQSFNKQRLQNKEHHPAKVTKVRQMTEDKSFEYYVEYCKTKLTDWIPRSHIDGECTQADLDSIPARTPEEVVNERKSEIVKEQARRWNLSEDNTFEVKKYSFEDKKNKRQRIKMQQKVFFGLNMCLKPEYPSEHQSYHGAASVLHLCNKCFYTHLNKSQLHNHMEDKCKNFKQPGRVIYHEAEGDVLYKFYELDGSKNEKYCLQLCHFAKFFIDSKTICYAVKDFMFYILTKAEGGKEQAVGYFSKNRNFAYKPSVKENLSVILVFPPFIKKGYASWLVDLSYKIGIKQSKCGTPENPLSEGGYCLYMR